MGIYQLHDSHAPSLAAIAPNGNVVATQPKGAIPMEPHPSHVWNLSAVHNETLVFGVLFSFSSHAMGFGTKLPNHLQCLRMPTQSHPFCAPLLATSATPLRELESIPAVSQTTVAIQ